jgi:NADH dehydrogenase/NADH:ubiquinone oxidoreductase subunit G
LNIVVKFTINDKELEAEEGTTVLEAAREAGIPIPTLCYHKELTPYGACRLCQVEVTKRGWASLQPACLYRVFEGLIVKTDTERVQKTRKIILELLLARSPESEILQALGKKYGVTESRFRLKNTGKCILCGLCERACTEISQRGAISFANRGKDRVIQTPFGGISQTCIGCGACAHVCPTGNIEIEEAD